MSGMISDKAGNLLNRFANNPRILGAIKKAGSNPSTLAKVLIGANVARDAINCGFYVNQSLHNEKIPEEKRKFVAALDLANGGLMCLTQLILGLTVSNEKFQEKVCEKFFKPVKEISLKRFENCSKGFTVASSLIVTAIIAKRVIVPFIATPLAGFIKNKYMDKTGDKIEYNSPMAKSLTNDKKAVKIYNKMQTESKETQKS